MKEKTTDNEFILDNIFILEEDWNNNFLDKEYQTQIFTTYIIVEEKADDVYEIKKLYQNGTRERYLDCVETTDGSVFFVPGYYARWPEGFELKGIKHLL